MSNGKQPELWTIDQVAEYLGYTGTPATAAGSARKTLHRLGVAAVSRQPGRGGKSLYLAQAVRDAHASRPGQGVGGGRKKAS